MRAMCFDGSRVEVSERADPTPQAASAIVRVRLAGICNTDLEISRGYMGFRGVIGHEGVGDVVDGPVEWLGRRVVSEINFACGRCGHCEQGPQRPTEGGCMYVWHTLCVSAVGVPHKERVNQ